MARRRLLPALRGLETKTLYSFGGGRSVIPAVTGFGYKDRAAGWDMDKVVEDGYERVVWVFKAVEVIAGHASRLPFTITGEDTEVDDHPLLRVLNKQANPLETGRIFRKRLSQHILLSKRGAFVEVTKSRAGQIVRLDLLDPSRVQIIPDQSGDYISYYEFTRLDGTVRYIAPERIRWIREPHPLDPFSGVTPLEAAGMSTELDHLARTYNVSFIRRDGRPGGILGVDADDLDDDELDRINDRLKPGPQYAGQITAIGTGPGGMTYIDTAARPRDMAYETTSEKAKKEILAAFGVPESMAGDASGRTWDNAEQEEYNFWQDPMLPHMDLIAAAFDGDVDEDLDCGFDTSKVEALELPARRRREERRTEWREGLITIKEYRAETEYEEIDNAHTRALWISPSRAPVPARPEDAVELGLAEADTAGADTEMGMEADPAAGAPQTAAEVVQQALAEGAVLDPAAAERMVTGPAQQAVDAAREEAGQPVATGAAAQSVEAARMEGKSLGDPAAHDYDPGEDLSRRVELAVAAALDALLARQAGVVTARMESPKARRGTRYWEADGDVDERVGDDPIDAERAVDAPRWAAELQETLLPVTAPAGREAAEGVLAAMAAAGALTVAGGAVANVVGRAPDAAAATGEQVTTAAARAAVAPVMLALAVAQEALADWLSDRVVDITGLMVEEQLPLSVLLEQVRALWEQKGRVFASSLATSVAQAVVLGAREAAVNGLTAPTVAATLAGGEYAEVAPSVERTWLTRQDERVRATHEAAAGQVRLVGEAFDVGGHSLRFPSDPLAPPGESRHCRCWLKYSWPAGAVFHLAEAS